MSSKRKQMKKNTKFSEIKSKLGNDLLKQNIYNTEILNFKVKFKFNEMNKNLHEKFIQYAKKNIMGKCHKEGYVSNSYIRIIDYSSALLDGHYVYFDVQFEFMVCYPYEGMVLNCKVQNITKIGVKGVISDNEEENPIIVFASRIHNESVLSNVDEMDEGNSDNEDGDMNSIGINKIIRIKVIGFRFEINDPYLSLLGEIIKDEPNIIMD